jgi:hypothetical protein
MQSPVIGPRCHCALSQGFNLFFNMRLTLSCEIVSRTSNCISLAASRWRVQRPYPSGGSLPTSLVTWAFTLVSILMGRPLRGASGSTSRMWACAIGIYFLCTLYIVPRDTPKMVVSSCSGLSASKRSKMRAVLRARAFFFRGRQTVPRHLVRVRLSVLLCASQAYFTPPYGGESSANAFIVQRLL